MSNLRCKAISKTTGRRCKSYAQNDSDFCFSHRSEQCGVGRDSMRAYYCDMCVKYGGSISSEMPPPQLSGPLIQPPPPPPPPTGIAPPIFDVSRKVGDTFNLAEILKLQLGNLKTASVKQREPTAAELAADRALKRRQRIGSGSGIEEIISQKIRKPVAERQTWENMSFEERKKAAAQQIIQQKEEEERQRINRERIMLNKQKAEEQRALKEAQALSQAQKEQNLIDLSFGRRRKSYYY